MHFVYMSNCHPLALGRAQIALARKTIRYMTFRSRISMCASECEWVWACIGGSEGVCGGGGGDSVPFVPSAGGSC